MGRTLHVTSVAILEMSMTAQCVPGKVLALGCEERDGVLSASLCIAWLLFLPFSLYLSEKTVFYVFLVAEC